MYARRIKGLLAFGMNGVAIGPNSQKNIDALKNAAVPTPGEARLDYEILARIFLRVPELYAKEGGAFPDPIVSAAWNYTDPQSPSLSEVAKEINGRDLQTGQQLSGFGLLRDDG